MLLSAKKTLFMLMLSKFIGKVFALCSDSSKNRELREIVFISSS